MSLVRRFGARKEHRTTPETPRKPRSRVRSQSLGVSPPSQLGLLESFILSRTRRPKERRLERGIPPRRARAGLSVLLVVVGGGAAACGGGLRRFPQADIVWEDPDRTPIPNPPEPFYSPYIWDGMDQAVFRPLAKLFGLYDRQGEAENVNALDEVPNSSWYTNRLSVRVMTPEEVARGACKDLNDDLATPWLVTSGKPDGSNPGFFIKDANGVRYLLKTDGTLQPERPTGSDVIGAALYHAAGYFAPCNRVVTVTRDKLVLDPEAEVKFTSGQKEKMTEEHIEQVLSKATPLGEGRFRASVSEFIEGRPISPWIYEGTRDDDPNDVIPHAFRREVRGMYVLAAWTDHIDSRQENTLAAWIATGPRDAGYVRHYMIDFGDTLGILFTWDALARRFGHSGYFDLPHMAADYLTLGLLDRPWHHAQLGAAGRVLGYFDARRFEPDEWTPGYPNPAFQRHTERDAAWMARIIARLTEEHIAALAERGRFTRPLVEAELVRILVERRRRILERYLTRLSPLTWPGVVPSAGGADLCMQDLAVWSRIRDFATRTYEARAFSGDELQLIPIASPRPAPARADGAVCVRLPDTPGATPDAPEYLVVDLRAFTPEVDDPGPARLHFWADGRSPPRVVGLERPEGMEAPKP